MDTRLLDEDKIMQICFITDNLERSVEWFSDLTGKEPSEIARAAEPDLARAVYRGKPSTVRCRLVLFEFGNIDVEFLEPGPEPSVWRDFIEERGPGCHHIAFRTRNLARRSEYLVARAMRWCSAANSTGAGADMRTTTRCAVSAPSSNSSSSMRSERHNRDACSGTA